MASLASVESQRHQNTERAFDKLKRRFATALDFIASIGPEQIDGREQRVEMVKLRAGEQKFTELDCLLGFAQPNFHLRVVTACANLRHNGVPLCETDCLGNP